VGGLARKLTLRLVRVRVWIQSPIDAKSGLPVSRCDYTSPTATAEPAQARPCPGVPEAMPRCASVHECY
jgi:hypothetical protein